MDVDKCVALHNRILDIGWSGAGRSNTTSATKVEARDTFFDLYQPGYNPFVVGHPRQLFHVLKNWLAMVREGHWKVDADGIVGGIEEWRKADTEEHWGKYVVPFTW